MEAEESTFYFESDHVAFRNDPDYNKMLRYLTIRYAQRSNLSKHIEELMRLQKVYSDNPELFLEKLRSNMEIVPSYITTHEKMPQLLRQLNDLTDNEIKTEPPTNENTLLRSLPIEENKPETFNRLWTYEEQRRLEELLNKYPPEPIEMHRFTKIAKELGNRTPIQVSSRVQKYFQKLYDAGLPIPGRIPKNRRSHTKIKQIQRSSTFFPAYHVPVTMPDDDFNEGIEFLPSTSIKTESIQNIETKPTLSKLEHERVLQFLKLIRNKIKENKTTAINPCESCYLLPKNNFHWHCFDCSWRQMLCSDCMIKKLMSSNFEHILHNVVIDN